MIRVRPLLAAAVAVVFYAISDILVWQRIFEANQMVGYAGMYHAGWIASLAGYAAIGVIVLADRWKDCVYFLTALSIGAFSGLEDILYYVLDGKPIPESLPWLSGNPLIYASNRTGLIASALFWFAALCALYVVLFVWRQRPSGTTHPGPRMIQER